MVLHGNQPEWLRQLLVHWLSTHPLGPLEDETLLVQSNGIAQWLKLSLAADPAPGHNGGCGIAAALDILLPSRFVWRVYRSVLGPTAVPEVSPFDKPQLIWRLMRLLPQHVLGSPTGTEFAPLARFLKEDGDQRKTYQLAEKIADLFDQYQVYRADWLTAWARGEDRLPDHRGNTRMLPEEQRWQAALWRVLLADVGPHSVHSRAAIHQRFLDIMAQTHQDDLLANLPRRVSIFGLSALPRQSLDVLLAIARHSQVILCVHNPCEHYWADLLSAKDQARRASPNPSRHRRKPGIPEYMADEDLHLYAHPLLAAWGKQGRDYIGLLDALDNPDDYRDRFSQLGQRIDLFQSPGEDTLLHQLQDDIRLLRSTAESRQKWPAFAPQKDHSLRFHVAHSRQREVDILHDQLLAAFDADATLKPRDILVMVPDIDAYAPHIEAAFGQIDPDDPRHIPFSLADRTLRQQAPLALALTGLLNLPESRLTVHDVLDLLDVPSVRQRFGIAETDLPLLTRWTVQSHIRWGLDAAQCQPWLSPEQAQNTWRAGLRRMLLGYAIGGDPHDQQAHDHAWHDIEPYAEISGLEAVLLGALEQLLDALERLHQRLATPATPAEWGQRLEALLDDFFACTDSDDALLERQLRSSLTAWVETCNSAQLDSALPLAVVREHWLTQIDQPGLTQRFFAGRVTFATLMPMRAIPFRRVGLLGMNDGEFPRTRPPLDFDLMAHDLRPGDRSRRDDDRYLFLEALLSAREALHISWIGRSIHDNSPRAPSVLVSQLRDHLANVWSLDTSEPEPSPEDKKALLAALTVEHPLHPFSPCYFTPDTAPPSSPSPYFTYAQEWERPAHKLDSRTDPQDAPLPALTLPSPHTLTLADLAAFLKAPAALFFQKRLKVFAPDEANTTFEHEPFTLDALAQWQCQNELIQARFAALCAGTSEQAAVERQLARQQRRGELPLGAFAELLRDSLQAPLDEQFEHYRAARLRWPDALPDLPFQHCYQRPDSVPAPANTALPVLHLEGLIRERFATSSNNGKPAELCRIALSSRKLIATSDKRDAPPSYRADRLLADWVAHLAAQCDGPPCPSWIIGKSGRVAFKPLPAGEAKAHLDALLSAYLDGLCAPLPLAPRTAFAWLGQTDPARATHAARKIYEPAYQYDGEIGTQAALARVYPDFASLSTGGDFATRCQQLYAPLLAHLCSPDDLAPARD